MEERGQITEEGCYTLTPPIAQRLLKLSFETGQSQSYHVRRALDLYFERLESQKLQKNASNCEFLHDY